ncbi:MAG: helix-turn-helix transcriptional regulator [Clostridia bacterium]|nr:helix-turn-helix transcriptional regulator [Clostridia bacterium]
MHKEYALLRQDNDNLEATWCFEQEYNRCMPHFHLCVELLYVEAGSIVSFVNGEQQILSQGQMIVIPSYAVHHFESPTYSKVIVAVIPMPFVPSIRQRLSQHTFAARIVEHPELASLIILLSHARSREMLQGLSEALLADILDIYGSVPADDYPSSHIGRELIQYMQQHYEEDLTLSRLASHFNYSESRISHLFRTQLNTTFPDYLNRLRCRQVAEQLSQGADNVLELATKAGFNSVSTFYRAFKKNYGVSPLSYAARTPHQDNH